MKVRLNTLQPGAGAVYLDDVPACTDADGVAWKAIPAGAAALMKADDLVEALT